ncbi:hypothetical protein M407DRAFT_174422 [Tulasnella calospora MUT 4182]|uniref:Uncharacterized protein n=1 Tax=Tulasnella calospora MUT 4182 TaxID=1051891 RepID=A0A0C3M5M0_9AGAM|nr:hypothetical protein M407DRAFT_174422 [Tulasnella calospora MUT 4182]
MSKASDDGSDNGDGWFIWESEMERRYEFRYNWMQQQAKKHHLARNKGETIVKEKKHRELARQHNLSKGARSVLMETVEGNVKDVATTKHDSFKQ